jgi:hypothetical protein
MYALFQKKSIFKTHKGYFVKQSLPIYSLKVYLKFKVAFQGNDTNFKKQSFFNAFNLVFFFRKVYWGACGGYSDFRQNF